MRSRFYLVFLLIAFSLIALGIGIRAQEAPALVASGSFNMNVRGGPNSSYPQVARLTAGVPVRLIERNSSGTWVRIQQMNDAGAAVLDGWVLSGFLSLPADARFSAVPVSPLPDALPEHSSSPSLTALYSTPIIPAVSDRVRAIYEQGRDALNYSHVVTKVGDSLSADALYLTPMSRSDYRLGPYDYLDDTVRYFGASVGVPSVAAKIGMNTFVVFDPLWSDPAICNPGETPLACEYRRKRPAISVILFGPNDVRHLSQANYEAQMRRILDETIAAGVIPVLSTFSYHPNSPTWWKAVEFNNILLRLAAEYEIPIINLWLAARALPDYGLEVDLLHMKHWGFNNLKFDAGHPAYSGASLRNLLTIRMLDEIRRTVILREGAIG